MMIIIIENIYSYKVLHDEVLYCYYGNVILVCARFEFYLKHFTNDRSGSPIEKIKFHL